LLRQGLVRLEDRRSPATGRFQREQPNQLWQMDFKSPKGWDQPVGPLSVLDDASRYAIALDGIGTTRGEAVRERLETSFRDCGVPDAMLMDHGCPWWNPQAAGGWTQLSVWLMKQGVRLYFSGVRHPQTQGKVERFHGTLEMARRRRGLPEMALRQRWLDDFRHEYNHLRPHEALAMKTPASMWQPSRRRYDPTPSPWQYPEGQQHRQLARSPVGPLGAQRNDPLLDPLHGAAWAGVRTAAQLGNTGHAARSVLLQPKVSRRARDIELRAQRLHAPIAPTGRHNEPDPLLLNLHRPPRHRQTPSYQKARV
jgi:hypothetical protein